MKKFFTLIAAALMTMGVNAQTWNFSELEDGDITETKDFNGLSIVATSDKKITVDASKKTFDDVEYTKRLKFGGTGSAETRHIAFNVPGDATITIHFAHSSSSGDPRTLNLDKDAFGTTVTSQAVDAGSTASLVYNYTGGATKFYAYSINSGLNLYAVIVKAAGDNSGDDTSSAEVWEASSLDLTSITNQANPNTFKAVPAQYPGDAPANEQIIADATASLTLTDYIFTASTANVTLKGVSTPNSDTSAEEAWRFQGAAGGNKALDKEECPVKFGQYIQAKTGNPSLSVIEYFFTNSDKNRVGPRYIDTYWTADCGKLPAKGEYYEISVAKAGTFLAGIFLQRPYRYLFVIDKATTKPLAPSAITFNGYNNNNTIVLEGTDAAYTTFKINDEYIVTHNDPTVSLQDKEVFGFISFPVEANKTYLLFSPQSQLGLYGFQFTPGGTTGIQTVKTQKAFSADAPMYNMAGQKVDKSYKGIVIQNGRKFVNK